MAAKRRSNDPLMQALKPSAALAAIIGPEALPRTEIVKRLWSYILANQLQDPNNKRFIIADAKLKKVLGGKKIVSMFEMTKLVAEHLKS
jgi:chromatin remodeling complex protein RSC6